MYKLFWSGLPENLEAALELYSKALEQGEHSVMSDIARLKKQIAGNMPL